MSITLNPGVGGVVVPSDLHGGEEYPIQKTAGNRVSQWPGYSPPSYSFPQPINIDDFGSLQTRGPVLTDEGTFRVNFANTSLFLSIGAVTVSGNVVTGTGFATVDLNINDYFKIAADADTFCVQIDSIDSDTRITLKTAYTGSASGTGNRSLMMPYTGTGGSYAVASGVVTLTAGTTATSVTGVKRYTDYGPLVFRARGSISQRIANQALNVGLREDAATPRWFSWFVLDGTVNTTVKCRTGRNPSGAPSASETQETVITLPNNATTATARDLRIELLTESVRFYVEGILVAEHSVVIPHQHDEMTSVVEFVNGTTPATSTTATFDYVTGKNHNKLEIGIMSDAERIIAAQPPLVASNFTQAGVININTDVLIIPCSQIRTVSLQASSIGTTGRLDFFLTNDLTVTGTAQPAYPIGGGAGVTTTTAAGMWVIPTGGAAFMRVRMGVATTAGTTTIFANGSQAAHPLPAPTTQPVSGTVTANIGTGSVGAGTNAIGDVGVQYRANATGAASVANLLSPATPAVQAVKASAGRLLSITATNTNAAARFIKIWNTASGGITLGTTAALLEVGIPPNQTVQFVMEGGIGFATAISMAVTGGQGLTNNAAITVGDVTGIIAFA
jgi:hypothetical protein